VIERDHCMCIATTCQKHRVNSHTLVEKDLREPPVACREDAVQIVRDNELGLHIRKTCTGTQALAPRLGTSGASGE
jgi:hypothetical protein